MMFSTQENNFEGLGIILMMAFNVFLGATYLAGGLRELPAFYCSCEHVSAIVL
jgi:hypothetical protein